MGKRIPGLFITGTDTTVGKTYVGCLIARALRESGLRVGVYKPAASGCRRDGEALISEDALALWQAAGWPGELERVCPQRFAAPLAPHLAARAEGREIDESLLRSGLDFWLANSEIVIVEGAGGLMSPLSDEDYVAHLAAEFGYPLVVVARNALGTIHQTLSTLIAAAAFEDGLPIAGVVLNRPSASGEDPSIQHNACELEARCVPPLLAEVRHGAMRFDCEVDWRELAGR